ncbi:MAG: Mannose-phosphate guanylyltransferase [Verrucomicrobia bacterium]|nr:Mannose-phosphate guanylyltransferase [Verrucomicrobiota bacterium]
MKEFLHGYVCIMAGGSGERFWPMSRQRTPKHLLKLLSERTLVEETVRRVEGVVPPSHIFVLTNTAQLEATRTALAGVLPPGQVVAEPAKRDTACAAALATGLVRARDPQAVMALLPADSFIRNSAAFATQLRAGLLRASKSSSLLTFAIKPRHASTSFGYLEMGGAVEGGEGFRRVVRFVEKPDAATAARYLASGMFAWNAGMFVWSVDAFLAEAEKHAPALAAFVREFPGGDPAAFLAAHFPTLEPRVSIDYAIMEKAASVETMLAEFDWDDVGLWTSLPSHLTEDAAGNSTRGNVVAVDASRNIAVSNGRVIALVGVNDLVVVETPDAILVCHRDKVGDIKQLMPKLPKDVL